MTPELELPLNPTEAWIAEHSIRIFLVIAVLILAAGGGIFYVLANQAETQHQVDVLKPEITKVIHTASVCAPGTLRSHRREMDCARQLATGFKSCRLFPECRAAVLFAVLHPASAAPEGGDAQNPIPPGQHPGPGSNPGRHHHATPHHEKPPKKQLPSPPPAPATPAPPAPPASPSPGNSGNTPGGEHGVKACVEIAVSACVHAGLGH